MIKRNSETMSFENEADYKFLSDFEALVREYCKDNEELRRKIMSNFFASFNDN